MDINDVRSVLIFKDCIWDRIFHIYCPGCGGTRSLQALLKGDLLASLWFHPLIPYSTVICLVYGGSHLISFLSGGRIRGLRFHNWYLYAALVIMILNWIIRNLLRILWNITL